MNTETFVNAFLEAWNSRSHSHILKFYDPDYRGQEVSDPDEQYGREGVQQMLSKFFTAFPDLEISVLDWVGNGKKVSLYWEARGTNNGRILNIPPTGRKVVLQGVSFLYLSEGRITRGRHLWDVAAMLRAMGLLPELRAAGQAPGKQSNNDTVDRLWRPG